MSKIPHEIRRIWCKKHKKNVTVYRDFSYWYATCGCDSNDKSFNTPLKKGIFKKREIEKLLDKCFIEHVKEYPDSNRVFEYRSRIKRELERK